MRCVVERLHFVTRKEERPWFVGIRRISARRKKEHDVLATTTFGSSTRVNHMVSQMTALFALSRITLGRLDPYGLNTKKHS
jgi:hypothetical protein